MHITKFIKLSTRSCMDYPVGTYITTNLPIIKEMIQKFKSIDEYEDRFVNIICRGSSGAIIATLFALELPKCKIVHVKKEGENSHSGSGYLTTGGVNLIVDDLIGSGATMNAIFDSVKRNNSPKVEIDVVCITGESCINKLEFIPKNFICGFR